MSNASSATTVGPLVTLSDKHQGLQLLAQVIPGLDIGRISRKQYPKTRQILQQQSVPMPEDVWLGAWRGSSLVGVVHASVPEEAEDVASAMLRKVANSGDPDWLVEFTQRCALIDEVGVRDGLRKQGVGRLLVSELHNHLKKDPTRSIRSVTAYATNPDASLFFKAMGYAVGPQHEPAPSAFLEGLRTKWEPLAGDGFGAWAYRSVES